MSLSFGRKTLLPLAGLALISVLVGYALYGLLERDRGPLLGGPAQERGESKGTGSLLALQDAFVGVAEKVRPAVVNIGTVQHTRGRKRSPGFEPFGDDPFFRDFFEHFFGQGPRGEFRQSSLGSGVIIDRRGYILTNFHVIRGADEITVKLSDKRALTGKIIGTDSKTDLAVVRISPNGELPVAQMGNSDKLRVGEWAIAIGNPFGLDQTVTVGVVSATGRADVGIATYENFIQTDASINPGNSGGPLLNIQGEVIGINTAIVASGQGIGFAIPINMARRIVDQLISKGKVTRGWLGVAVQPLTEELAKSLGGKDTEGALISTIYPGSPAEKAGLQQGDLLIQFGETKIRDFHHLQRLVAETEVGKTVTVKLLRKQRPADVQVKIAELPPDDQLRPPARQR